MESRGLASSAGPKPSSPWRPLTDWRADDRHHQQSPNSVHHGSHSQTGEPRTGAMSKVQILFTSEFTHQLESHHEQSSNAACHQCDSHTGESRTSIVNRVQMELTTEATHKLEPMGSSVSRVQIQSTMEATHFLESQGQVS